MMKLKDHQKKVLAAAAWIVAGGAVFATAAYLAVLVVFIVGLEPGKPAGPAIETASRGEASGPDDRHALARGQNAAACKTGPTGNEPVSAGRVFGEKSDQAAISSRYSLMGTSTGEGGAVACIIDSTTGEIRFYIVGDTLAGGRIGMIVDREVFVLDGERMTSLYLGEGVPWSDHPNGKIRFDVTIAKRDLDYFVANANSEAGDIVIEPVESRGKVQGVLIRNIPSGLLLGRMGIMDGDIVNAVNGKPVESVKDFSYLLTEAIRHDPAVAFDITRGRGRVRAGFNIF